MLASGCFIGASAVTIDGPVAQFCAIGTVWPDRPPTGADGTNAGKPHQPQNPEFLPPRLAQLANLREPRAARRRLVKTYPPRDNPDVIGCLGHSFANRRKSP